MRTECLVGFSNLICYSYSPAKPTLLYSSPSQLVVIPSFQLVRSNLLNLPWHPPCPQIPQCPVPPQMRTECIFAWWTADGYNCLLWAKPAVDRAITLLCPRQQNLSFLPFWVQGWWRDNKDCLLYSGSRSIDGSIIWTCLRKTHQRQSAYNQQWGLSWLGTSLTFLTLCALLCTWLFCSSRGLLLFHQYARYAPTQSLAPALLSTLNAPLYLLSAQHGSFNHIWLFIQIQISGSLSCPLYVKV